MFSQNDECVLTVIHGCSYFPNNSKSQKYSDPMHDEVIMLGKSHCPKVKDFLSQTILKYDKLRKFPNQFKSQSPNTNNPTKHIIKVSNTLLSSYMAHYRAVYKIEPQLNQKQSSIIKIPHQPKLHFAGIIKQNLNLNALQYFRNFKFKMEAQGISDSSSQSFSDICSHHFSNLNLIDEDHDFDLHLQALLAQGLPVFVFDDKSLRETENLDPSFLDERNSFMNERILTYNRKAKSLEELSKKFIEHFEGKGNNIIQLDKITHQLGVQRRRIYDVINILESLNVVGKKGKNNYEWRGLCEAVRTINRCVKEGEDYKIQNFKKEKSLQYLAGGFLKLFISWKPAISLEQAAKQMMKEIDEASVRTKIRRLYDIINVFRSLGLVRKTSLPSKKPGYEWAGIQFLEHLIIKKQFCDENTGLSELNNEDEVHNPEEKTSSLVTSKNSVFSPFICPQAPRTCVGNFKLGSDSKQMSESREEKSNSGFIDDSLFSQTHQFPIFRKSFSAFSLVAEGKKTNF